MKYLKNTSWLMAEKILRMVAGLFVGIWVARYLGPEQFGLFSYALSFVGLFTFIATLGLNKIIVRELVKDEKKRDITLGTAFLLKLIGAIIVLIILAIAINFTSNDFFTNKLIFIIASGVIFQSFNVIDFYFQSKVLSRFVVFSNTIGLFISSIIKVVLILSEAPLIAFAWMIVFDGFVVTLGYIYFYLHNQLSFRNWKFSKDIAYSLLKDSWPLILSGMVVAIYMRIDQVMIKEMLGSEAVGQYAAAVRLSSAWYFIPVVVSSSLFPAITNAKKQNEKLYYSRIQKLYDLMVWIAISVAIPMTFLSDWIVNLLYGESYNQAGDVLMIHIWAGIFVALGVARGGWLLNENLQKYTPIYLGVGMIVNVVLNFILIDSIGINGAAYATLIAQCTGAFIMPFFIKKTRVSFFMMLNSIILFPSIVRYIKHD